MTELVLVGWGACRSRCDVRDAVTPVATDYRAPATALTCTFTSVATATVL